MNLRYIAAKVIDQVTDGSSLADCLDPALKPLKDPRDRAFVQAVCYGVCRFYARLDVILSHLLKNPMQAKDSDVHALLLVGLYQIIEMRVPPHAAVAETVNATEKLKKPWARGLVNAILREYLRQQEKLASVLQTDEEALYAHPGWWIDKIKKDWPAHWQQIVEANNQHPPMSLRVNQRRLTRDAYLAKLTVPAQIISAVSQGLQLESPVAVDELPGFLDGDVFVQDGAAQLAAELMQLQPGQRVLDACAAPGGKLTHILECEPALAKVTAVEKEAARLSSIKENLQRLQLHADCVCADAGAVSSWWDGELFDRILLDAPCSASGVIRRHPDIKLLRQPTDIKALAREQKRLLEALWPLLKPGGLFLYATCSVFADENTAVMESFLSAHPDASEEVIEAEWGLKTARGRQILPGMDGMDGFYYALLRRN